MKEIIYLLFVLLAVGSALYIALSRNILYTAISLLVTLSAIAGMYVLLGADFLAGIQLLVYVGGVLVLLLFAVLLVQGIEKNRQTNPARFPAVSAVVAGLLLIGLVSLIWEVDWQAAAGVNEPITKSIGNSLLQKYILPFELISVLLLLGLIGGVTIARLAHHKNEDSETEDNS